MAARFDYPAQGWSTGKMRKRGQRTGETEVAMDYTRRGQPESNLAEMERAAGFGLAARGGPTGTAGMIPQQAVSMDLSKTAMEHKAQIQDSVNQLAQGDITPSGFKKMLKRLGWSGDPNTGVFTAPDGQEHTIQPTVEAEAR